MLHDDYLCLVEPGKQQIKEVRRKFNRKTWQQRQLQSKSGFVQRIALLTLSRDRRIKIKKSKSNQLLTYFLSKLNGTGSRQEVLLELAETLGIAHLLNGEAPAMI